MENEVINQSAELWKAGFIGFVVGAVLVGVWAYFKTRRERLESPLNSQINKLEKELKEYRDKVHQHFSQSADNIEALTKNLQTIFQQFSKDAHHLMDEAALKLEREKRQDRGVTLRYLSEEASEKKASADKNESKPSIVSENKASSEIKPAEKSEDEKNKAQKSDHDAVAQVKQHIQK